MIPKDYGQHITKIRYEELEVMNKYINLNSCYMKFIAYELSDENATACNNCANCLSEKISADVDNDVMLACERIMKNSKNIIVPRKQFSYPIDGKRKIQGRSEDTALFGKAHQPVRNIPVPIHDERGDFYTVLFSTLSMRKLRAAPDNPG